MESEIEKDLFEHYWLGRGTNVRLTDDQFARAVDVVSGLAPSAMQAVVLGTSMLIRSQFAFPPGEFDAAFGTASVFYNSDWNAVGFFDTYNFDLKSRGNLSASTKVLGVQVACALAGNCVPFDITYGQCVEP